MFSNLLKIKTWQSHFELMQNMDQKTQSTAKPAVDLYSSFHHLVTTKVGYFHKQFYKKHR